MAIYWYIIIGVIVLLIVLMIRRYQSFMGGIDSPESEKLIILNDKNFKNRISKGITLIDFWAVWCQPCKIQGPIVSQVAENNTDSNVKIAKLDVEKNPIASQKLGIKNIPTIIIFKNGKEVERLVGLKNKKALEKALEKVKG